jgi:single-stranded-DNA-specific exonuclease
VESVSSLEQIFSGNYVKIIPRVDLDSIIAASLLLHSLAERGVEVVVNFDLKNALEGGKEEILLLNLSPPKNAKLHVAPRQQNSTLTGSIVYEIDRKFGVSVWGKMLAISIGVYDGYDIGKEGFRGVEKSILNELLTKGVIEQEPGFRFWGYKRVSIAKALTRTINPPLPGLTGREDSAGRILSELKIPASARASETSIEQDQNVLRKFIQLLDSTIIGNKAFKEKLQRRLVGYVYTTTVNGVLLDLLELSASLSIYMSLLKDSPIHLLQLSMSQNLLYDFLNIYEETVDSIAMSLSSVFEAPNKIIELPDPLARPELVIEAVRFILPSEVKKPLIVRKNGYLMTSVNELLRAGYPVEEVYAHCDPLQLCGVKEDGSLAKA